MAGTTYNYVKRCNAYAESVTKGKIPACRWVRLACERHLADWKKQKRKDYPYRFDMKKAERPCRFAEKLPHVKGKWAAKRQRLQLEDWQVFLVCVLFGWIYKTTGLRRFRKVLWLIPRKNGKSILAAVIGLYLFCADDEYGAEVYSGATSEDQAWEVFRPAKQMAEREPKFRQRFGIEVNAKSLVILETGSRFRPVIGKPGDGSSPSCAIHDEYHEHASDEQVETMETGMGAREQPLQLIVTTAGSDVSGPCYSAVVNGRKMLNGGHEQDELFYIEYTIDPEDDWSTEESLKKANPNYGVSIFPELLQARLREARHNPRKQSAFQTKHLNRWVGAKDAYFNVQRWRDCASEISLEDYLGWPCYLGLDLASKVDIAALEILIPDGEDYTRFGRYYLPESAIENGVNEHYEEWMKEGWLTITEGEIIDFGRIKEDILGLCEIMEVLEVGYDPHQATMLVTELMDEGVPVVEIRPTVLNFSEPMKMLDGLIRAKRIKHNGDPVMTWMISNVVAKEDAKDNVYPRKEKPENKIDGVVAHLSALNRAMLDLEADISEFINDPLVA